MENTIESDGLDAFIFTEFFFSDEVNVETIYKKFYFFKESEIDASLKRLAKRNYLEFSARNTSSFTCPEQGVIEETLVTKYRITDLGKAYRKEHYNID